jgi:peptidoglycan/LPS O-acetylase OafA/YrhL
LLPTIITLCLAAEGMRIGLSLNDTRAIALREWTFTRYDSLLLGGAAALIVRSPKALARVKPFLRPLLWITGIVLLGFALNGPVPLDSYDAARFVYLLAGVCFTIWFIRLCVVPAPRFLANKWLRKVGFYSYGMYVFHWPILQGVQSAARKAGIQDALSVGSTTLPAMAFNLVVTTVLSYVAAMISWRFWEKRWLVLKDRFAYHQAVSPALAADAVAPVAESSTPLIPTPADAELPAASTAEPAAEPNRNGNGLKAGGDERVPSARARQRPGRPLRKPEPG